MNNKGVNYAGTAIMLFVGVMVSLAIFAGITPNIGLATNTVNVVNQSVTYSPTTVLSGQAVSNVAVINKTGIVVSSGNYTVVNYDVSTGTLRAYLTNRSNEFVGQQLNVTYTSEPLGYVKESGSRSIVSLIAILSALAIIVFIFKRIYDDGLFDSFK